MTDIKKAIILAAGYGTRFLPVTKAMPKEMLPLVDKPLLHFFVEEILKAGVRDIIFVTNKNKRAIEDYFDRAPDLEHFLEQRGKHETARMVRDIASLASFGYVRQKEQKGVADAVLAARHLIGNEAFAVMSGDDIIETSPSALQQMIAVYKKYQAPVTCLIRVPAENTHKYGIIDGTEVEPGVWKISRAVEKPDPGSAPTNLATLTRFVLTPDFWPYLEKADPMKGEAYIPPAIDAYVREGGSFYGCEVSGTWYDCGDKMGYMRAVVAYGLKHPVIGREFRAYLAEMSKSIDG